MSAHVTTRAWIMAIVSYVAYKIVQGHASKLSVVAHVIKEPGQLVLLISSSW